MTPSATRPSNVTGTRLVASGPQLLTLDELSRRAGLHPALVARLFALGLFTPDGGTPAAPLFRRSAVPQLRRAVRLRRDLGLNYSGAVLASELLARIDELERQLDKRAPTQAKPEVIRWIRTV